MPATSIIQVKLVLSEMRLLKTFGCASVSPGHRVPGASWGVSPGPWYSRHQDARIQSPAFVRIFALAFPEKSSRELLGVTVTSSAAALCSPYDSYISQKKLLRVKTCDPALLVKCETGSRASRALMMIIIIMKKCECGTHWLQLVSAMVVFGHHPHDLLSERHHFVSGTLVLDLLICCLPIATFLHRVMITSACDTSHGSNPWLLSITMFNLS